MRNIVIVSPAELERKFPTFAMNDDGEVFLVHRTHANKDAITWATSLNEDGERVRFDEAVHKVLPIGSSITLTV